MTGDRNKSHRGCVVLFPGALGDFLCFLPAADALRDRLHEGVTLAVRHSFRELVADRRFHTIDIERREVAGMFGATPNTRSIDLFGAFGRAYSWTGARDRNFRRNLTAAVSGPVELFPFRDFRSGEHATDRFARCLGVTAGPTRIAISEEARQWAMQASKRLGFDEHTLVIHPGSGSAAKNWAGMGELADRWRRAGGRAIALAGPADRPLRAADATVREASIARVAALLERSPFYVGNDSGVSHLAAAVACRGIALFAETDPSVWRPRGDSVAVLKAKNDCGRCSSGTFCTHRLDVEEVLQRVDRYRAESYRPRP